MTKEEILAMEAGKDLDMRVAKDVMGCEVVKDAIFGYIQYHEDYDGAFLPLQPYSQDKLAALSLPEMLERCYGLKLDFERLVGRWEANLEKGGINYYYPELKATSFPEAICKVALLIAHSEEYRRMDRNALYNEMSWLKEILKDEKRSHAELLKDVVAIELDMFRRVRTGGASSNQESLENFSMERETTHSVLSIETLESYLDDLQKARIEGRNLLTEKYARMQNLIPPLKGNPVIEDIVKIEAAWIRELSEKYPHSFKNRTADFENYLSSELATYSEKTLDLYHKDISKAAQEGKNLAEVRCARLFQQYGYKSIAEAEEKASANQ